jgi:CheY-like chemotaxis protein
MATDRPPNPTPPGARPAVEARPPWSALLIEDNTDTVRQIREYFEGREVAGRRLVFTEITDWRDAFGLIRQRKADLAILDIYRGEAASGGERVGERVLDDFQHSGFIPVVIYTALPEGLVGRVSEFVRLTAKTDGLAKLADEVEALFATRIPQVNRAILNHLDRTLSEYMWGFVAKEWPNLRDLADQPEFLRVLLGRLAYSLTRSGVDEAVAEAFEDYEGPQLDPEKVHPAEFYLVPPLTQDPALGDVRIRKDGERSEYLVVLWPTCDMVSSGDRKPKVERVLCARATPLAAFPEAKDYANNASPGNRKQLVKLITNNRDRNKGPADSIHFLPAFLKIPNLLVEFRELEVLPLGEVKRLQCLGVVASPYAEQLSYRFDSYRGRVGVPDLDLDHVVSELGLLAAAKPPAAE